MAIVRTSVGPCLLRSLSQTGIPLLRPHYQTSSLLWMPPTSNRYALVLAFYTWSLGTWLPPRHGRISLVSASSQCKARCGLRSRGGPWRSPMTHKELLPAGDTNPSASSNDGLFGTHYLHGRLYPLPLHLASFRAYASIKLLPAQLQGSIPGPWLAVTLGGPSPLDDAALPGRNLV
jgi:hypothetical protein